MAGGGGRPRCPPGALLAVAAVVVAAGWARAEQKEEQSIDLIGKNEVYGDTRHEVSVYVKVFTNSPFLVCMDLALSQEKIIDPNYLWTGPDGRYLQGQGYVNLTETGKLMVMGFRVAMSGAYTCTLSHKVIETTTQEEIEMVEAYKFMVYAYREADHAYQMSVRFSMTQCRLQTDALFVEKLNKILNSTISHLTCHITASYYKCHSIRTPKNGLQHELFVNFLVNPFAPGWEEVCHEVPYDCEDVTNRRVRQAAELIGRFFHQLRYVLKYEFHAVPTIQYVDNSFSMTPIDSCRPGFGKNHHTHQNCASCCVVCSPGTYSPDNGVTCQTCDNPQARMYGAVSCY
ncbi:PREDICTED: zona pellucida-binding protein 2 [Ficedula albicollis]|uniref:Zona pellucida binding protein 2 n=1 Tax=Ficedula albicollis TaxID=59894 RepID=U3JCJ7_FICAL|nr:PREDICTED: zona pellucida-binding protein 2 [Ficedula albicollis]XP_005059844.1 PREDICTED: zona pellucida-binding protein 2 [Ficedula albicollis]XP_016159803.1 PREDICTED: zona pellucida-binding protein 2 [Ficedula albicollis]